MANYSIEMTVKVFDDVKRQPQGVQNKIYAYITLLENKGHALLFPYVDRIEGYKNLWELRPHFHNIEYRMIYFWFRQTAYFTHSFEERGKKSKNRREYETADRIKMELMNNLEA